MRTGIRMLLVLFFLSACHSGDEPLRPEITAGGWNASTKCGELTFFVRPDGRAIGRVVFSNALGQMAESYALEHQGDGWPIEDDGSFDIVAPQILNEFELHGRFGLDSGHANGTWELPSGCTCQWEAASSRGLTNVTGRIAFVSQRDGDSDIYVMNPDGSQQTNLTNNPAEDTNPAWSPDWNRIAFASDRDGNREIYTMNADGTALTRLTYDPEPDYAPDWSPDGTRITFSSGRDGDREVYVMDAFGSGQVNLTRHPADDGFPDWSPDGTRIAFTTDRYDPDWAEIYLMNVDGSGLANLSNRPGVRDVGPAWSPDGSQILLWSFSIVSSETRIMNSDGSGHRRLGHGYLPAWSPDGDRIAFCHAPDGDVEIFVMNLDGSGVIQLTHSPGIDSDLAWAP